MKNDSNKSTEKLLYQPEITAEDKKMLRDDNAHLHNDGSSDRQLQNRKKNIDFAGKDLDIPGRNKSKKGKGNTGLHDEENKLHSQGGDRKSHLETDNATF
ncbi:MAG: hypothetical protein ABF274_13440 [Nonlabens sp.]|uniref:hypothetical protein n=1 Tax=Nonlabens sp. TaxID=1888209 RepID=UPI00321AB980